MDSVGEELVRLAGLRASGDLTDEEFEILKARLVGIEPNAPTPSEQVPIPTAEAVGEDVSAYEMTDWTTEDEAAFSQRLVDLGVPHEFDKDGDLIVSPLDEDTVDQVMDDFLDMPDGQKGNLASYRRHSTDKISGGSIARRDLEYERGRSFMSDTSDTEPGQETSLQATEDQAVATHSGQGAVSVGDGVNLSVNVTQAATAPQVVVVAQSTGPHFVVRAIWFLFIGWWLSGFVMLFAWFMAATIVGLPIAFATFNRVPMIQTLRPRTITTRVTTEGGVTVVTQGTVDQLAMWVRAIWFVFVGWWLGLIVTLIAWVASVLVITLPLSIILIDRLPEVITLQKN